MVKTFFEFKGEPESQQKLPFETLFCSAKYCAFNVVMRAASAGVPHWVVIVVNVVSTFCYRKTCRWDFAGGKIDYSVHGGAIEDV